MPRRAAAVLAAVAALVLGACGGPETEAGADVETGLFDFTATTVDGTSVDMAQFADSDLIIWFWAPW